MSFGVKALMHIAGYRYVGTFSKWRRIAVRLVAVPGDVGTAGVCARAPLCVGV